MDIRISHGVWIRLDPTDRMNVNGSGNYDDGVQLALYERDGSGDAVHINAGKDQIMSFARRILDDLARASDGWTIAEMRHALEESVKLQSHYAGLLNQYDGGERMQFSGAEAWMDRLDEVNAKKQPAAASATDAGGLQAT